MEVNAEILKQKCEEFRKVEGRASFYDIAMEIVDEHPLQASIIILAFYFLGALMAIPAEETVLSPILSVFKWVAVVMILLGASDLLLGCAVWYYANKLERRLERVKGR